MKFTDFDLNPKILKALHDKGYDTPTEIQQKTLEAFSNGKHVLGQSQTGSWKTAAFLLPVLNKIDESLRAPQVLILAPTRELAAQIRDEVFELSKHMYIRSLSCFGGISKRRQIQELRKWPQIIVGTPWRVADLIEGRFLKLQDINYFILDEVDRMLDMWFIDTIEDIWNRLDTIDQALTFSATLPDEVMGIIRKFIGNDFNHIAIKQEVVVDTVDHMFISIHSWAKYEYLKEMLTNNWNMKTLIFTEMKRSADDLARRLDQDWFSVDALHGDMDQRDRFHTLRRIKNDEVNVLVATDVAARWLNMNNVNLVINYDVPNDPESYVHRIGRTARAGKSGSAIMFVDRNEMRKLYAIERTAKMKLKQVNEAGEELQRTDNPQRWGWRRWRSWGNNYRFRSGWWGWGGRSWGGNRGRSGWGRSSGWGYRWNSGSSSGRPTRESIASSRAEGWSSSSRPSSWGYRGTSSSSSSGSRSSWGYRGNSSWWSRSWGGYRGNGSSWNRSSSWGRSSWGRSRSSNNSSSGSRW